VVATVSPRPVQCRSGEPATVSCSAGCTGRRGAPLRAWSRTSGSRSPRTWEQAARAIAICAGCPVRAAGGAGLAAGAVAADAADPRVRLPGSTSSRTSRPPASTSAAMRSRRSRVPRAAGVLPGDAHRLPASTASALRDRAPLRSWPRPPVHATLAVAEEIEAASASRLRSEIPRPGSFRLWCLSPGSLASARCPDSGPAMRSKGSQDACAGALSRAARQPVLLQARP
jgi:hypothetical protein